MNLSKKEKSPGSVVAYHEALSSTECRKASTRVQNSRLRADGYAHLERNARHFLFWRKVPRSRYARCIVLDDADKVCNRSESPGRGGFLNRKGKQAGSSAWKK